MSNLLAIAFGLGNQELFFIAFSVLFFAVVVWSIYDLMANTSYSNLAKLVWVAAILFFPVFGTLFYLYYGRSEKYLSKK